MFFHLCLYLWSLFPTSSLHIKKNCQIQCVKKKLLFIELTRVSRSTSRKPESEVYRLTCGRTYKTTKQDFHQE